MKYPNFVDIGGISESSDDMGKYRYVLCIPFMNRNKDFVAVILKNPSKADTKCCDITVSKVCNAAKNNGYGGVYILNLFPYRATKSIDVRSYFDFADYEESNHKNLKEIKKTLWKVRDIIFVWGTNTISDSKKIKAYYCNTKNSIVDLCKHKNIKMVEGGTESHCMDKDGVIIRYLLSMICK